MSEKEVFYPAEEYYRKQNNCEFYLIKTDYKLLMIDDIVSILNNQRETIQYHRKTEKQLEKDHARLTNQLRLSYDKINKLTDENEKLKQELSKYKDFVLSDDKILCYTCLFCTHKGIYEVDCDVKGHVDVHGTCHCYTKKELKE